MKILVAEDNAVTATLMTGILTRHGYTVVLARNGTEALRLLGSDPGIQGVITDIMMPESGGLICSGHCGRTRPGEVSPPLLPPFEMIVRPLPRPPRSVAKNIF